VQLGKSKETFFSFTRVIDANIDFNFKKLLS